MLKKSEEKKSGQEFEKILTRILQNQNKNRGRGIPNTSRNLRKSKLCKAILSRTVQPFDLLLASQRPKREESTSSLQIMLIYAKDHHIISTQ